MRRYLTAVAAILITAQLAWATTVSLVTATPSSISFAANNPGSPVTGSAQANVTWRTQAGANTRAWNLKVAANSASFTTGTGSSCTLIPASAVTVTCSSGTVTKNGTVSCAGFSNIPLSTTPTQVAGGNEGAGTATSSIYLTLQLNDSWKYVANTCPLVITYTVVECGIQINDYPGPIGRA